jgi:hypothetical protein
MSRSRTRGSSNTFESRHSTAQALNAVATLTWIAITVYLLVAIVKKELGVSLYQILHVAGVSIFDRTPISQAFRPQDNQDDFCGFFNQLNIGNILKMPSFHLVYTRIRKRSSRTAP